MDWLTIILITLIFLFILKTSRSSRQLSLVNLLPGPVGIPFIGTLWLLFFIKSDRSNMLEINDDMGKKHGPIYRTLYGNWPEVHIFKADYMEPLLSSSVNIEKGAIYKLLHPWLGTGLLTSSGQKWFTHRKMITPTFHFKILENFIDVFSENMNVLVEQVRELSRKQKEIDIYPFITRCALDIINETAMGVKVNAQKQADSEYLRAVYKVSEITFTRHLSFWLLPDFTFYRSSTGKEYVKCLNTLHGFTEGVIRDRMKSRENKEGESETAEDDVGSKKKKMFLDLLLDANTLESKNKLSTTDIREEVDTFMFEGHDTTTVGMTWTIFLLALHPKIQEKLFEEIEETYRDDPSRTPTMKDLNEMKYLERVIKESLRLFPSVPFFTRTLTQDVQLGQYLIPNNTEVVLHIRELHQDPEYFPDPQKFDPDRFLPENIQTRHPYAYVPFSAGPRNCIGQKFAMLEEKLVISEFVRNFKFTTKLKVEDLKLTIELVLRPHQPITIQVEPRDTTK